MTMTSRVEKSAVGPALALHRRRWPEGRLVSAGEWSGWRDQELSRRHQRWGFACPAVDLDFVLVEFGLAAPSPSSSTSTSGPAPST